MIVAQALFVQKPGYHESLSSGNIVALFTTGSEIYMNERAALIQRLLAIISDYRAHDRLPPDVEHVEKWLSQFPEDSALNVLKELVGVLEKSYFSKSKVIAEFAKLVENPHFVGNDPAQYWKTASLLDIQKGGNSQHDLNELISSKISEKFGVVPAVNSVDAPAYYYMDDMLCSGNRVFSDISSWIRDSAPTKCTLWVCIMVLHEYGYFITNKKLLEVIGQSGKQIKLDWGCSVQPEDRKYYNNVSDVLRPTTGSDDGLVKAYIEGMKFEPVYRVPESTGKLQYFSSEAGRHLLEQQFLIKGAYIRSICPNLKTAHRPLGFSSLDTLGFGTMVVTYRNCPNNAPLALWVGDPWYPLFPRSTNADAALRRMFDDF